MVPVKLFPPSLISTSDPKFSIKGLRVPLSLKFGKFRIETLELGLWPNSKHGCSYEALPDHSKAKPNGQFTVAKKSEQTNLVSSSLGPFSALLPDFVPPSGQKTTFAPLIGD